MNIDIITVEKRRDNLKEELDKVRQRLQQIDAELQKLNFERENTMRKGDSVNGALNEILLLLRENPTFNASSNRMDNGPEGKAVMEKYKVEEDERKRMEK